MSKKVLPSGITIEFEKVGSYLYATLFLNSIPETPLYRLTSEPLQSVKKTVELVDKFAKHFNLSQIKNRKDWDDLLSNKKERIYYGLSSLQAAYSKFKGADAGHYDIKNYKTENNNSKINIESKLESFIRKIVKEERQRIKENSSQAELQDLATDLIDYLGGQLPNQGYTRNQRIMDYFRELGYKDNDPMIHKIYNLALKLNR